MPNYLRPVGDVYISCSWQCHRSRNPPSSEAGTDYACGYGTAYKAPHNGVVDAVKTTNSGAMGRVVMIHFDDGNWGRGIHCSSVKVSKGQRVSAGQIVAYSGGSANGSDHGVGSHLHWSWWPGRGNSAPSPGSTATSDYEAFLGSGGGSSTLSPSQRRTGPNGANGRVDPSTAKPPVGDPLKPGAVANFVGWQNGEAVSGNKVWFKGTSGRWFWSGGFEGGAKTTGLTDLNTPAIGPTQRQAGKSGANGRSNPTSTATIKSTLAPDAIGDFDGWINGERVENNGVWFRGATSKNWFWSGGFTNKAVSNLTDLNPQQPDPGKQKQRTVGPNSVNGRSTPNTKGTVNQSLAKGTVADMDAYTNGQDVEGNKVWFRGAHSGDWFWSGGFIGGANVAGLPLAAAPTPPDANNPRGLVTYEPVNPHAQHGLVAPLGDGLRGTKGIPPVAVPVIIDRAIIHHTGTVEDQLDYFSWKNPRNSAPTWYVRPSGEEFELIRPSRKPASTGPEWNWRSVSWEVLDKTPAPTWEITDAAKETVARDIAWLAEFDGLELDGIPVDFKIDAVHVIGHNQALPGTECPGPDMDVPGIIARAKVIYAENNPDVPIPPEPSGETVEVPREELEALQSELDAASATIEGWLSEE